MNKESLIEFAHHLSDLARAVKGISKVFNAAYPEIAVVPKDEEAKDEKKTKKKTTKRDPNAPKLPGKLN